MTGTDLCVRLYKSVPVIFEPPCIFEYLMSVFSPDLAIESFSTAVSE